MTAAICCFRLILDGGSNDPATDRVKAIDFARRALEIAGDDPDVLANAAQVLAFFREDIEAMAALVDRTLALHPGFARGWSSSAAIRLLAGEPELAVAHAETALRLSPRSRIGPVLCLIGMGHFFSRRFDEAAAKLAVAIQEDTSHPMPYRYLAASYAYLGRMEEAQEVVARLRGIAPLRLPDASYMPNPEHRALYLAGMRAVIGEQQVIDSSGKAFSRS